MYIRIMLTAYGEKYADETVWADILRYNLNLL